MISPSKVGNIQAWVATAGVRKCLALTSRSALRALPFIAGQAGNATHQKGWEELVFRVFRANFIAWACCVLDVNTQAELAAKVKIARRSLLEKPRPRDQAQSLAIEAAACATACAVLDTVNGREAAILAAKTVSEGAVASKIRIQAFQVDRGLFVEGSSLVEVMNKPLWFTPSIRNSIADHWARLAQELSRRNHNWEVWQAWYDDRLYGRAPDLVQLSRWIGLPSEKWEQNVPIINLELKRVGDDGQEASDSVAVKEPDPEPGPEFDVTSEGLSLRKSRGVTGLFDQRMQHALHERLKDIAPALAQASRNTANIHRGLSVICSEYERLIVQPFNEIDVIALWAVGAGLLANRDAFARAHHARTMTEPLEPAHFALLQQASEVHGGFILGFAEARELADRADRARVSGEAMERVVSLAREIIELLLSSGRQVDAHTRQFLAAIGEGLIEPGWRITRAGFAAYVVTRNALIAIGRLLSWANSAFATVVGGLVLTQIDPGLVHTQFWIEFVTKNSQQILAFAEPFPELKIWLAAQIEAAERDK
jgi:hypothetical protein